MEIIDFINIEWKKFKIVFYPLLKKNLIVGIYFDSKNSKGENE